MNRIRNHSTAIKILFIISFALALVSFRLIWIQVFQYAPDQPVAKEGLLDLRDWDFEAHGRVTLSGEWLFYPYQLVDDLSDPMNLQEEKPIAVPGDWSSTLNEEEGHPYGYGTYHLKILLDPAIDQAFSIQIPSVRSASRLYGNGQVIGESGEVGKEAAHSFDRNVPYLSSTLYPNEAGEIELFLEASNYVDPRASGLIRSVKFGVEQEIVRETSLSTLLQIVAAVIFMIHALFALIIYFVGIRDQRLLYFSLLVFALAIINLTIGDEKVIYQYLVLEYGLTLKGASTLSIIFLIGLVRAIRRQIDKLSKYLVPILSYLYLASLLVLLFLPIQYIELFNQVISVLTFISFLVIFTSLIRATKEYIESLPIVLAMIAILNHFFWLFYFMTSGVKVVHYPFDLIVAIVCIAFVWFKHYYRLHTESLKLTERLTLVDKAKDEFLMNTSHELRNPLHSILNMTEAVLRREKQSLADRSVKDLETITIVSRRMSNLLDELLDIASIEEGKPKLHFQSVSMKAIAAGVIDMVSYTVEGKPIQIINYISDEIPNVYGDENRLTQVLFNLVHNAIKYTPEGRIGIHAKVKDNRVYISVSDTGVGMSEETVQRIFERYAQGDNAAAIAAGGFGIGLYVSYQLIELHKGKLSVRSKLGEGSTFTFSLPKAKSDLVTKQDLEISEELTVTNLSQERSPDEFNPSESKLDLPRILVVDDEKINLHVIESILSPSRYEVSTVLSAKQALEKLEEQEWDLIISDVMMPDMSGYELSQEVRQRYSISELPILLLTARSSREDIEIGFMSGANDYVIKPVDASELCARVRALTSARKSMRQRLRLESAWLQAQIKPHFLFNTLNSILALSQFDQERMVDVLTSFSDVLRAKFNFESLDDLIPIQRELDVIESYVYIEETRFGERLQVMYDIDEDLNVMIPTLSILPLVENAINHGAMSRDKGGTVKLKIKAEDSFVQVTVSDDGKGIEESIVQLIHQEAYTEESGVALMNINMRLRRLFGESLDIQSEKSVGTRISFKVPKTIEEGAGHRQDPSQLR